MAHVELSFDPQAHRVRGQIRVTNVPPGDVKYLLQTSNTGRIGAGIAGPIATAQNRAGYFLGLGTQSLNDLPADQTPDAADLETAEVFGRRVAEATERWVRGAA